MKRWIVAADDFALSAAVDDGILALIDAGLVTATSCLTTAPRWRDAARRLDAVRARADVGVHIDLTEFERLASSHAALVLASYARRLDRRRLGVALRGQLQRFEDALGRAPDYVDGHRHVHQLPVVRDVLVEVLAQRYAAKTLWVRVSRSDHRAGWKGRLVTWLGSAGLSARCRAGGFAVNSRLLGIYGLNRDFVNFRSHLAAWVEASADRDVLMCHPAASMDVSDSIGRARLTEFETMSSPWWRERLTMHGIRLCRGAECIS